MASRTGSRPWFVFALFGLLGLIFPAVAAASPAQLTSSEHHVPLPSALADEASQFGRDGGVLAAESLVATAYCGAGSSAYDATIGIASSRIGGSAGALGQALGLRGGVSQLCDCAGDIYDSSGSPVAPTSAGRIPWTSFDDYPKVTIGGRQYADVGGRPYTQHAVDRMQPSGLGSSGMPGGASGPGRSISPNYVDDVLTSDLTVTKPVTGPLGQARTSHVSGSVEVITEGDIVITIITR